MSVKNRFFEDFVFSGTAQPNGAGLDVFEKEPVTADNPLFGLQNTALAPHVSALTYETNYNGGIICAQSIINVAEGGKPLYPLW